MLNEIKKTLARIINKYKIWNNCIMKDYIFAGFIGFITAVLVISILFSLKAVVFSNWFLFAPFVIAFFWILIIYAAKIISRRFLWFFQLAKFVIVGFLNTSIDFGILNFFMALSGISSGSIFSGFKSLSFIIANLNSYFWNKRWSFQKETEKAIGKEYLVYLLISIASVFINVGLASLIVNVIGPQFGFSAIVWANMGAAIGTALGLVWNFLGYKFLVFKK